MDTDTLVAPTALVEGGVSGLDRVALLLRAEGVRVEGVYIIGIPHEEGGRGWYLRIVSDDEQRQVLLKAIALRQQKLLPKLAESIALSPLPTNHPEASRIIARARKVGETELVIDGQMLDGLYVDYALIGSSLPVAA
jgi:hypothetical protein